MTCSATSHYWDVDIHIPCFIGCDVKVWRNGSPLKALHSWKSHWGCHWMGPQQGVYLWNGDLLIIYIYIYHKSTIIPYRVISVNKANLRDLIAATGLVILLKFDPNHWFFSPCDLKIWCMTSKNNSAPLLYYINLCVSFQIHQQSSQKTFLATSPVGLVIDQAH